MSYAPRGSFSCRAYAKINLTLEILGKRPDGYHEIVTMMHTVELHDTLTFRLDREVNLASDNPEMTAPDNLILRAARELQTQTDVHLGADIHLEKRIPMASGLGGGSSDAACALRTLNKLWKLDLTTERLSEIGAHIGSDVPFFFYGGAALAEGRGEIITPLPSTLRRHVLLVCPHVQMADKTRVLYSKVRQENYSDGSPTRLVVEDLRRGRPVNVDRLVNVFLPIMLNASPVLRLCYERMSDLGLKPTLSGAGPTLFAFVNDESEAQRIKESLGDLDADIFITYTKDPISAEEVLANDAQSD